MNFMLCRNKVADFAAWKQVFDSHAGAQQKAGLRVQQVLRNIEDPQEVFMLFEVADIDKARRFVTSDKVPEAQKRSGVVENPDIYFLTS